MLLDAITITAPDATTSVTITRTPGFDAGARTGYLLDTVEIGPAAPRIDRTPLLYTLGEHVVTAPEGARPVRISGQIIAGSRAAVNGLRAQLLAVCRHHSGGPVTVRYTPAGDELELECVVENVEVPTASGAALSFTLDLLAPHPVAYLVDGTETEPLGSSGSPTTVENMGDTVSWPAFVITGPSSGTCTGIVVGNATTGETLTLTGLTLGNGDTIEIVTRPGYEEIAQDGENLMAKRSDGAWFWSLPPGESQVYLAATGGTGTAGTISWTPGWVGY